MPTSPVRIWRHHRSPYYRETEWRPEETLGVYSDDYFRQLRDARFNAVWLHAVLRKLVRTAALPEIGEGAEPRMAVLRKLVDRAARHGVAVYLYFNEPRCFPKSDPFCARHPELMGTEGPSSMDEWPEAVSMCTSTAPVRDFVREGFAELARQAPGLGGALLITASEHRHHCYSHSLPGSKSPMCPRCAKREPSEVIVELIRLVRDGLNDGGGREMNVVAWNWSWARFGVEQEEKIIRGLPGDICLMGDCERGGSKVIRGVRQIIDEYSLSYAGPSERFLRLRSLAGASGKRVWAKLQIGTTHELATVPNLPLIPNLARKVRALRGLGVESFMGTWNFGNELSLNTFAAARAGEIGAGAPEESLLEQIAGEYFGLVDGAARKDVVAAWHGFCAAMDHYPFSVPVLYSSPVNYALCYPLLREGTGRRMGRSWINDPWGDDLSATCRVGETPLGRNGYTCVEIIAAFAETAQIWEEALPQYQRGLASAAQRERAGAQLDVATLIPLIYRSASHIYRAFDLRTRKPAGWETDFRALEQAEACNLESALPILERRPDIGWHYECQHLFYDAERVRHKTSSLKASAS